MLIKHSKRDYFAFLGDKEELAMFNQNLNTLEYMLSLIINKGIEIIIR